ncbi:MAG: hypothetical protein RIT14_1966 [Pseudomonadota bacterium]
MPTPKGYSRVQIGLHWIMAVLILLQLIFGEGIGTAWRALQQTGVASYDAQALAHIGFGAAILLLALWRLWVRATRGVPAVPEVEPVALRLAANAGHWAFYVLMIGVPLTGLLAWFGGLHDLAELHELAKPAFILLIAIHVAAALWHQFWLKDGLLARMRRAG